VTTPDPRAGHEASRLLQAAQDWLRSSAPHLAPVGPDGEPCSCPLCRAVAGLRDADPDAVGRWVDSAVAAATALATQAADLAASATRSAPPTAPPQPGGDQEPDVDADAASGDDLADDIPGGSAAGQDRPRPRGVRRIPVEHDPGAAAR
jgi:hypothetical protein